MFIEVFVEGGSDVPTIREILTRRFHLKEYRDFKIHPHRGKGKLPNSPYTRIDPKNRTLLHQLPAKLRAYANFSDDYCVIVLVDADNDDCILLKQSLVALHNELLHKPRCVLFRIAVEEIESWFIAEPNAILRAYPKAKISKINGISPDSIIGAWEHLAIVLNKNPSHCNGYDKKIWAEKISPRLDLNNPKSPSLYFFIQGVDRIINSHPV